MISYKCRIFVTIEDSLDCFHADLSLSYPCLRQAKPESAMVLWAPDAHLFSFIIDSERHVCLLLSFDSLESNAFVLLAQAFRS